jgi:hypothetical protein
LLSVVLMFLGCSKTKNITGKYDLPPELSECKIYELAAEGIGPDLVLLKCPESNSIINARQND